MRHQMWVIGAAMVAIAGIGGCGDSAGTVQTAPQEARPADRTATASPGPAPVGTVWRSVRLHGGRDALPIVIGGRGVQTPVSEPRAGGVQRIEVSFARPSELVDPKAVRVEAGGERIEPKVTMDGGVLVIQIPQQPDRTCVTVSIAGAVEGAAEPLTCTFRNLQGDVTNDGEVTAADAQNIKARVGQPLTPALAAYDVDLSGGEVRLGDALALKPLQGNKADCR